MSTLLTATLIPFFLLAYFFGGVAPEENGALESIEVIVLLSAVAILLGKLASEIRRYGTRRSAAAISYCLVLLFLPLSGAARELSFGRVLALNGDIVSANKILIVVLAAFAFGTAGYLWIRHVKNRRETFVRLLRSQSSRYVGLAILLIIAANEHD